MKRPSILLSRATVILFLMVTWLGTGMDAVADETSTRWFQGGTLHNATVGEWKSGTNRDKLATAADWLSSTIWKGKLRSMQDFDQLKVKAQRLVNAVDEVAVKQGTDSIKAMEIAAAIITMSNDLGP